MSLLEAKPCLYQNGHLHTEIQCRTRNAILIPPNITLQAHGRNTLTLNIEDLGESFQYFVYFWEKEKENPVVNMKLSRKVTSTSFDQLVGGREYCVSVVALAIPISKNSSRTLEHKGLIIGLLSAFMFVLVPLALAVRRVIRVLRDSCCPQVDIPDVLNGPYTGRGMASNFYVGQEKCESLNTVELHDLITS
ncbi:hypothetical protein AB205_0178570 [Aquarana catesbeiana]|uniref:Interferon/interleukin receptor domain-containing protein n=1 Tax=Aquarana catesbeiana TaxID=8400 RepID=A0A2G9S276_AQUCT|nr:hypothetical protein AB205_0178570 [Aquarana catesbeiana]PIO34212.1 hypothetical protein AB205_0178570 [Aquarana catesbeiana]